METLNSLDSIQTKLIKMLVDSNDEAVKKQLRDVLGCLSDTMAKEMRKLGVEYIG